jgi:hypothetical protein
MHSCNCAQQVTSSYFGQLPSFLHGTSSSTCLETTNVESAMFASTHTVFHTWTQILYISWCVPIPRIIVAMCTYINSTWSRHTPIAIRLGHGIMAFVALLACSVLTRQLCLFYSYMVSFVYMDRERPEVCVYIYIWPRHEWYIIEQRREKMSPICGW